MSKKQEEMTRKYGTPVQFEGALSWAWAGGLIDNKMARVLIDTYTKEWKEAGAIDCTEAKMSTPEDLDIAKLKSQIRYLEREAEVKRRVIKVLLAAEILTEEKVEEAECLVRKLRGSQEQIV